MTLSFPANTEITLEHARNVAAQYTNVFIEDLQPAGHFRIVIRGEDGRMIWRYWSYATDAPGDLNKYLKEDGKRTA
ncbi:DUF905 family protein [Escherichia coli]|jgi:hypothetical protein|uniref:DUF905 family protein n=1 Tax=Buttiauxella gaviniae TaxID=82990 RepID=UPI001E16C5DB|nr:DUF905 family protein [Escherichia coli]